MKLVSGWNYPTVRALWARPDVDSCHAGTGGFLGSAEPVFEHEPGLIWALLTSERCCPSLLPAAVCGSGALLKVQTCEESRIRIRISSQLSRTQRPKRVVTHLSAVPSRQNLRHLLSFWRRHRHRGPLLVGSATARFVLGALPSP